MLFSISKIEVMLLNLEKPEFMLFSISKMLGMLLMLGNLSRSSFAHWYRGKEHCSCYKLFTALQCWCLLLLAGLGFKLRRVEYFPDMEMSYSLI